MANGPNVRFVLCRFKPIEGERFYDNTPENAAIAQQALEDESFRIPLQKNTYAEEVQDISPINFNFDMKYNGIGELSLTFSCKDAVNSTLTINDFETWDTGIAVWVDDKLFNWYFNTTLSISSNELQETVTVTGVCLRGYLSRRLVKDKFPSVRQDEVIRQILEHMQLGFSKYDGTSLIRDFNVAALPQSTNGGASLFVNPLTLSDTQGCLTPTITYGFGFNNDTIKRRFRVLAEEAVTVLEVIELISDRQNGGDTRFRPVFANGGYSWEASFHIRHDVRQSNHVIDVNNLITYGVSLDGNSKANIAHSVGEQDGRNTQIFTSHDVLNDTNTPVQISTTGVAGVRYEFGSIGLEVMTSPQRTSEREALIEHSIDLLDSSNEDLQSLQVAIYDSPQAPYVELDKGDIIKIFLTTCLGDFEKAAIIVGLGFSGDSNTITSNIVTSDISRFETGITQLANPPGGISP